MNHINLITDYYIAHRDELLAYASSRLGDSMEAEDVVQNVFLRLLTTDNHRQLFPATLLCGSVVALVCNLICFLPGESGVIPLNAVTPLIGAPVIIYVIARKR